MKKENGGLAFRKGDAAVIAAVVLAALLMIAYMALSASSGGETTARIYRNGELVRELRLDTDAEFELEGDYHNRITVRDGKIAITESDCPGEDCVHSGWMQRPGRSIVCLPNRVEIRLEGVPAENDVDAVVQ